MAVVWGGLWIECSIVGARSYENVRSQWFFGDASSSAWRSERGSVASDGMMWVCRISNAIGPVEVREAPSPARIACGLVRVIDTGSVNTGLLRADWVKNA